MEIEIWVAVVYRTQWVRALAWGYAADGDWSTRFRSRQPARSRSRQSEWIWGSLIWPLPFSPPISTHLLRQIELPAIPSTPRVLTLCNCSLSGNFLPLTLPHLCNFCLPCETQLGFTPQKILFWSWASHWNIHTHIHTYTHMPSSPTPTLHHTTVLVKNAALDSGSRAAVAS